MNRWGKDRAANEMSIYRKLVESVFGVAWIVCSLGFFGFGAKLSWEVVEPLLWDQVPCEIEVNEVVRHDDGEYGHAFTFAYLVAGETYRSSAYQQQKEALEGRSDVRQLVDRIAALENPHCRVNPADPTEAVLRAGPYHPLLLLVGSLPFIAIGVWSLRTIWRKPPPATSTTGDSSKGQPAHPGLVIFGSLFFLMGGGFLIVCVEPVLDVVGALNWVETPCRILSSEVGGKRSQGTYRVEVEFEYDVKGKTYRSTRYSFFGGSSSGYEGKAKMVNALTPGTETTCYVNPGDPREAVMNRGPTWEMLFGLIPIGFMGVGALIMYAGVRRIPPEEAAELEVKRVVEEKPDRPTELKPHVRPLTKFLVALGAALFWNGIVGVLFGDVFDEWKSGSRSWFELIFAVVFMLAGVLLMFGAGYCFLSLFNPVVRLRLSSSQLRAGETFGLGWSLSGGRERLCDFHIVLEGPEVLTTPNPSEDVVNPRVFAEITIVKITDQLRQLRGEQQFTAPVDALPSSKSSRREVSWRFKVKGAIAWWPDLDMEFPVEMLPRKSEQE